jgi:hypothetical protein
MGQVYHCWWRICREINVFFQVQNLIFISIFDLFTDYPSFNKLTNYNTEPNILITKCWEVLEWLHNWWLLKKGSAPYVSNILITKHQINKI